MNKNQINHGLAAIDMSRTSLGSRCPLPNATHPCAPGKYRSYSGHCNNPAHGLWGSARLPYRRFVASNYGDAIATPRLSQSGSELPNPRIVSLGMHQVGSGNGSSAASLLANLQNPPLVNDQEQEHPAVTILTGFFLEFVSHDLSRTMPATTGGSCCSDKVSVPTHPDCMPISMDPTSDPLAAMMRTNCMEYVRSAPAVRPGCGLGPREQINHVTSYLDMSPLYGSSESEAKAMKDGKSGRLRTQRVKQGGAMSLLPPAPISGPADSNLEAAACGSNNQKCFHSGDSRVNEHVGLTILHTVWMREHNRLARDLQKLNPQWSDSDIFEESRRILVAQYQHVVYSELLPLVLGERLLDEMHLRPLSVGHLPSSGVVTGNLSSQPQSRYDMDLNPGVDNAVATAVLPSFVLSMMPSVLERYTKDLTRVGVTRMGTILYNPADLYQKSKFQEYMLGMLAQNAPKPDLIVSQEMTNMVVNSSGGGSQADQLIVDFVAMAIQRGREHGIASYTQYRKACKLTPLVNNYNTLAQVTSVEAAQKLRKVYK